MSIYVVLLIILCNMTCWRASKVLATLFAINLGATQFYIGILVALYSLFPMLLALYAGGMGSAGANFYKDLVTRYGFGDAANAIQEAFLDGRRTEAAGLVPDAMIDELCLVGSVDHVRERLDGLSATDVRAREHALDAEPGVERGERVRLAATPLVERP